MRLLLEIVVAAALIALSWNKPFKDWIRDAGVTAPGPTKTASQPPRSPAPAPKSFTGHIYYTDEQGKSYWLDAQGKRHYQP